MLFRSYPPKGGGGSPGDPPPQTPCGLARNVSREGEESWLCPLGELPGQRADMFTTVLVGNSQTQIINGRLVTPRGYEKKGEL